MQASPSKANQDLSFETAMARFESDLETAQSAKPLSSKAYRNGAWQFQVNSGNGGQVVMRSYNVDTRNYRIEVAENCGNKYALCLATHQLSDY